MTIQTDEVISPELYFRKRRYEASTKRMPDYAYIRKELLRNGVAKNFCGPNTWRIVVLTGDEPLMYSRSAITSSRMNRKHRATMHINRKPEWTGWSWLRLEIQLTSLIRHWEIINAHVFVGNDIQLIRYYAEAFIDEKQTPGMEYVPTCTCVRNSLWWCC